MKHLEKNEIEKENLKRTRKVKKYELSIWLEDMRYHALAYLCNNSTRFTYSLHFFFVAVYSKEFGKYNSLSPAAQHHLCVADIGNSEGILTTAGLLSLDMAHSSCSTHLLSCCLQFPNQGEHMNIETFQIQLEQIQEGFKIPAMPQHTRV